MEEEEEEEEVAPRRTKRRERKLLFENLKCEEDEDCASRPMLPDVSLSLIKNSTQNIRKESPSCSKVVNITGLSDLLLTEGLKRLALKAKIPAQTMGNHCG